MRVTHAVCSSAYPPLFPLREHLQAGASRAASVQAHLCLGRNAETALAGNWDALGVETQLLLHHAGSPLTHARFLNRYKGTYGPAISAAGGSFPGPKTPIKGLYRRAALCCPFARAA